MTTSTTAVSCNLSTTELAARRQQLIPGLFMRADKVEDIRNGLRFHFQSKPACSPISRGSWSRSRTVAASSAFS